MATDAPESRSDSDPTEPPDRTADPNDSPHPAFAGYAAEDIPQAAVGSPGKDGVLALEFALGSNGTDMARDYATVPFHVSGTLDYDPHPDGTTVFVQSPTGGIAQGDRHEVSVEVGAGAVAHVTTQSSTKVQSMRHNYAAAETSLCVREGGHLDYVPEPTILHADARYSQELTVDVGPEATAVVADVVVPGRLARGERFDFERYRSRVRAVGPEGLLFEDTTHLAPAERDPTAPGVLGEFTVYGTAFIIAPDHDTEELSDRLHNAVTEADARAGATALPNDAGVALRALGDRAETVQATLQAAWDRGRRDLIDAAAPSGRKY